MFTDENLEELPQILVENGVKEMVSLRYRSGFSYLSTDGTDVAQIEKQLELPESCKAPIKNGEVAGRVVYYLNGTEIGSVDILYNEDVEHAGYWDYFRKMLEMYII